MRGSCVNRRMNSGDEKPRDLYKTCLFLYFIALTCQYLPEFMGQSLC